MSRTRRQNGEARPAKAAEAEAIEAEAETETEAIEKQTWVTVPVDRSADDLGSDSSSAEFTLFIAGDSEISRRALTNLRRLCNERLNIPATMLIIDAAREPAVAELNGISRTPTLIKHGPGPTRRIAGDLSNSGAVMACLEFPQSCVQGDAMLVAPIAAFGDAAAR